LPLAEEFHSTFVEFIPRNQGSPTCTSDSLGDFIDVNI
jgi:hypothetical protein